MLYIGKPAYYFMLNRARRFLTKFRLSSALFFEKLTLFAPLPDATSIEYLPALLEKKRLSRAFSLVQFSLVAALVSSLLINSAWNSGPLAINTPPSNHSRTFGAYTNTFYVSTTGSDSNNGTSVGTPFASLSQAKTAIAALPPGDRAGTIVYIRGGTYFIDPAEDYLAFDSNVSGTAGSPVTFANYPGEYPVFTNGVVLTVPAGPAGIVDLELPDSSALATIYSSTEELMEARTPNYQTPDFSDSNPWLGMFSGVGSPTVDTPCPGKVDTTNYCEISYTAGSAEGEISDPATWIDPTSVYISLYTGGNSVTWTTGNYQVASVDTVLHKIRLATSTPYEINSGAFYFAHGGSEELLDSQNEWLQEGSTLKYYKPFTASETEIIASIQSAQYTGLSITGSYITFRGLTFRGFTASDSVIRVSNASHISLDGLEVGHTTTTGINVYASTYVDILNSRIHDTAGAAIQTQSSDAQLKALTDSHILVHNNKIWNISLGVATRLAPAIQTDAVSVVVSNNDIRYTARFAIAGWRGPKVTVRNNSIRSANLLSGDTGAIYYIPIWSGSDRSWLIQGQVIDGNRINDPGGYSITEGLGHYGFGIYLDDWQSGVQVKNNIISGTSEFCMYNHSGRNNTWENNTCYSDRQNSELIWLDESADGSYDSVDPKWTEIQNMDALGFNSAAYLAAFPNLTEVEEIQTKEHIQVENTVTKNIFYSANGANNPRYIQAKHLADSNTFEKNVFYSASNYFRVEARFGDVLHTYNDLASWLAAGFDSGTIQANPLLTAPESDDYRVQDSSPALGLGFINVDRSAIGLSKVLPTIETFTGPDTLTIGDSAEISWDISTSNDYPLISTTYQLRQGSSSGANLTGWVVGSGSTATITTDLISDEGTYAACIRAKSDIRQPEDGSISEWSPESCLSFSVQAPATPTPSPSESPSPSPTPSDTPTPTPSVSSTPTPSPSVSASSTPTPSSSATVSNRTSTPTPSSSPTLLSGSTASPSPSPVVSASPGASPSISPTAPFGGTISADDSNLPGSGSASTGETTKQKAVREAIAFALSLVVVGLGISLTRWLKYHNMIVKHLAHP